MSDDDKKIRIECQGADTAPYTELVNLQGDLKILDEVAYQRFKKNIKKNGFSEPISVWNDGKSFRIVNGHQRLATIKRMVENENYEVGELPISYVHAKSYQEAKEKVLALTSEYGQVTSQGMVNFLMDVTIDADYIRDVANIKGVDIDDVLKQLGDVKSASINVDPLDVDAMVIGDQNASLGEPHSDPHQSNENLDEPAPKNDVMSGLRLLQIFVKADELEHVKSQIDKITRFYKLENTTEAIMKALDLTVVQIEKMESKLSEDDGPQEPSEEEVKPKIKKGRAKNAPDTTH